MTEMILGGDSYEKSCWYWFRRPSGTTDWVWDITVVILGKDNADGVFDDARIFNTGSRTLHLVEILLVTYTAPRGGSKREL